MGDPAETDGGGETTTTEAPSDESTSPSSSSTAEPPSETDDASIHDRCIPLVWACPSDDLVCLPEGLCVECAAEGESPASAAGGHCCQGLVRSEDGSECILDTSPGDCLGAGDLCGYSGLTQQCCAGSTCNEATSLCEPDGTTPEAMCEQWTPPQLACPDTADATADIGFLEDDAYPNGATDPDGVMCSVLEVGSDGDAEWVAMDCGFTRQFSYSTSAPHLVAPIGVGDDLVFRLREDGSGAGDMRASFEVRTPQGELLVAFVDDFRFDDEIPVDLAPLSVDLSPTGCEAREVGFLCDDGETILLAPVLVTIGGGDQALELGGGTSGSVTLDGRVYDVNVASAEEIVCWDESCIGDDESPFDHLRMAIVARP